MTFELSVKGQFSFRHREIGWKYSVGGRNSKGTECRVLCDIFRASVRKPVCQKVSLEKEENQDLCVPLHARIFTKCFTSVDSLI